MRQNPQPLALDQDPDSLEPAAAQAPGKHRIFHHDHPLIVEAKIRTTIRSLWRPRYAMAISCCPLRGVTTMTTRTMSNNSALSLLRAARSD